MSTRYTQHIKIVIEGTLDRDHEDYKDNNPESLLVKIKAVCSDYDMEVIMEETNG